MNTLIIVINMRARIATNNTVTIKIKAKKVAKFKAGKELAGKL